MTFVSGLIGANPARSDASPYFDIGTTVTADDGGLWIYAFAPSPVAAYNCVMIEGSGTASSMTSALALVPGQVAWAQHAFTTNTYGWFQRSGVMRLNVTANCLSNVPLYTSDTAGYLSSATASASQVQVMGVLIPASNSGSASNVAGVAASTPIIRRPAA